LGPKHVKIKGLKKIILIKDNYFCEIDKIEGPIKKMKRRGDPM